MNNDRRRFWNYLILVGLFLPFLALWLLHFLSSSPSVQAPSSRPLARTEPSATSPGPARATATAPASATAPAIVSPGGGGASLLAAGDGHDLWVLTPVTDNQEPGFQLLCRSANTGVWRPALRRTPSSGGTGDFGLWLFPTLPRALTLMPTFADRPGRSSPYLLGEPATDAAGWVKRISLDDGQPQPQSPLPAGHLVKAAAGAPDQLFVVTLGSPVAGATQIGDPLRINQIPPRATRRFAPEPPAGTAPSSSAPAASTASAPAVEVAATSPSAPPVSFNVYWLPPTPHPAASTSPATATAAATVRAVLQPALGDWCLLAPLGPPSDDAVAVPTSSSHIVLAQQDARLWVFWTDSRRPSTIQYRTLDFTNPHQQWSAPRSIPLAPEEFPNTSRLFSLSLDQTLYLLWTRPNGASLDLRGGWINTEGTAEPAMHLIAPMALDSAGTGLSVQDVAVGPAENSIVALVNNHDTGLKALLFSDRGYLLGQAKSVVPESPRRDLQVGQNVALILVVLMMTLMLWQWRQKSPEFKLPAGAIVAPFHLRIGAFAIDAVLPYAAVLLVTGNWENGGYLSTLATWFNLLSDPEDLAKAADLFLFLGLYLVHVTLGELFFRRSVGKALIGLQVLMVDGKAPTVAAVLLRNLVRIPECLVGVALLYMLISPQRQRLGDLLARTVVLAQKPPEVPADPDQK
jgi:uncharacterized RDD family membrane protein YckC